MTGRDTSSSRNRDGAVVCGLCVLTTCFAFTGCRFAQLVTQTVILEPFHFAEYMEEKLERHRHHRVARDLWSHIAGDYGLASVDYERGFYDGFVDFMLAGGTGLPPPYPPKYYWKTRYQSPEGHLAILDWYAGFEHGASLSSESGYRDLLTIPLYTVANTKEDSSPNGNNWSASEESMNSIERLPPPDQSTNQRRPKRAGPNIQFGNIAPYDEKPSRSTTQRQ